MTTKTHQHPPTGAHPGSSDPLLRVRDAALLLQISVPTFWRRVADGTVPKPVRIGGLSRWPHSEILGVIADAKARRQS